MSYPKSERTKQYIIEKAAPLFNKKGCADTSIMDIVAVTGLTKGAIYGNFENKDELAIKVFEYNLLLTHGGLQTAMKLQEDALGKLAALVTYYRDQFEAIEMRGGCAMLNAATEADDNFPLLKLKVKATINQWKLGLIRIIDLGKEQKCIDKKVNAEKYAHLIIALIEGGIMLAKATDNRLPFDHALDQIEQIIKKEITK